MKRLICTLLIISFVIAIAPCALAANDYSSYVDSVEIKKGDTLYSICKAKGLSYGTIKEAIMIANSFPSETKMSQIEVGQKILIPKTLDDAKKIIELGSTETKSTSSSSTSTGTSNKTNNTSSSSTTSSTTSAATKVEVSSNQVVVYEVKSGDTMNKICKSLKLNFSTCKSAIMSLNGWTDEKKLSKIYVGQKINFPVSDDVAKTITSSVKTAAKPTTTPSPAKDDTVKFYVVQHTMQRGETMKSVCKELGVTYLSVSDQLKALNKLSDLGKVQAGKTYLFISEKSDDAVYTVYEHTVVSGDTMYNLCKNYNVKYKDVSAMLECLNTNVNFAKIKVGQKILLVTPIVANSTEVVIK